MFSLLGEGEPATHVTSGHNGGERARDVQNGVVADPRGGCVLARENGSGVDGLALGVDVGMRFGEGLRRGEPLESGGGRGSGVDDEEVRLAGEDDGYLGASDRIGDGGDGVRERGECFGVEDCGDGDGAGIEGEGAGERGGEGEERGGVDGGGGEVEVEGEGDVGCEWVRGIGEGVWIDGCH